MSRTRFLVSLLSAVVLLMACAPGATPPSSAVAIEMNEGRRLDLVIAEAVDRTAYRRDVGALVRSAWSQSSELRSWFTMVDRVSDARNTLLLTVSLDSASTSSAGALNLPIVGRTAIRRANVTVSVTLIDPISGVIVGSATVTRSASDTNGDAAFEAALRQAANDALHQASAAYAGG